MTQLIKSLLLRGLELTHIRNAKIIDSASELLLFRLFFT
jgi:hypothetical protein